MHLIFSLILHLVSMCVFSSLLSTLYQEISFTVNLRCRECTFLICKFTLQTTNNPILYLFVNSSQRGWIFICCCCYFIYFFSLLWFSCLFYNRYIFTHALYVCYIFFVSVADCKLFSLFLFYIFHLASPLFFFSLFFSFMRKLYFHLHEKKNVCVDFVVGWW